MPEATFYSPLGVGSHVDHLVTQRAAEAALGAGVVFYEDFPYVARPGALAQRLDQLGGRLAPEVRPIGPQLERKVAAISAYASQLPELAHSQLQRPVPASEAAGLFAEVVAGYAREVGGGACAERVWRRA
jgi:LmbE family N-acetylglucosaminyl deacetylase